MYNIYIWISHYELPSRRPKLRLPNLENRPLRDPELPWIEFATDPLDKVGAGIPFTTLTKESCGDPADIEPVSPLSPGPEDTPLIPWRAKCAKWRCNGVCLEPGISEPSIAPRVDSGERGGGVMGWWPTCRGWTMRGRVVEVVDMDCLRDCRSDNDDWDWDVPGNWSVIWSEAQSTVNLWISSLKFLRKNFSKVSWKGSISGGHRCPWSLRQSSMTRTCAAMVTIR